MKTYLKCWLVLIIVAKTTFLHGQNEKLFGAYWNARTQSERQAAIKPILESSIAYQEVRGILASGFPYTTNVKRGFFSIPQVGTTLPPKCLVFVPYDYNPLKKYPLRVFLHGGVSTLDPDFVFRRIDTLSTASRTDQIIQIYPAGWWLARWWSEAQFQNINSLLLAIRRTYNVDENNVQLAGISDGGTASFYLANLDATPWAAITPFIGSLESLKRLSDKQVFINNIRNKPFFIVNAGKDDIFPVNQQLPYLDLLKKANPSTEFVIVDSSRHRMFWFPVLRERITAFSQNHPRNPFPDSLTWQAISGNKYDRCHYMIINKTGKTKSQSDFDDFNDVENNGKEKAFARESSSGFVKAVKMGNTIHLSTSRVRALTLLISADQFDFKQPLVIMVNGVKAKEVILKPEMGTLLKWHAIDLDRTMLFDAEVRVEID